MKHGIKGIISCSYETIHVVLNKKCVPIKVITNFTILLQLYDLLFFSRLDNFFINP